MRTRLFLMLPLICAPLAFWACGGDSGTSAKGDESSSSVVEGSSSSSVIPSSSSAVIPSGGSAGVEGSSSSVASSSSEVVQLIPYTTECPSGKTCTYAPTAQLNPDITYGELLDTRDNQVYKTVTIGTQIWMAQNLNYAYNEPTSSDDSSSFCYDNSADSCAKYGRLYLWSAAMDSVAKFSDAGKGCGVDATCRPSGTVRGVCPEGWHLPSDGEWNTLFSTVGGDSTAGTKLKSTSGWNGSGNGTDSYGFGVLPAGRRSYFGAFVRAGGYAYFWSSTELISYFAYLWNFFYDYEGVYRFDDNKFYGYSVRCLRDSNDEGSGASSSSSQAQPSSSSIKDESDYDAVANTLTDLRDNQTYKTVTIGTQIWMAQNLNYAYNEPTSSLDSSSFCYNHEADSCAKYGRLYLWSAAMDSAAVFSDAGKGCGYLMTCGSSGTVRGVCPEGWHLPSDDEWETLFSTVGGISTAGTKLKSTSGWNDNGDGADSYGFGVLPAGTRYYDGDFSDAGDYAFFWRSTEYDSKLAHYWDFSGDEYVYRYYDYKYNGSSVRCLKD